MRGRKRKTSARLRRLDERRNRQVGVVEGLRAVRVPADAEAAGGQRRVVGHGRGRGTCRELVVVCDVVIVGWSAEASDEAVIAGVVADSGPVMMMVDVVTADGVAVGARDELVVVVVVLVAGVRGRGFVCVRSVVPLPRAVRVPAQLGVDVEPSGTRVMVNH